jgi:hypothetical protein
MKTHRPKTTEYNPIYGRYIDLVPETDLVTALKLQLKETEKFLAGINETTAQIRYSPGKWSIREVVGHILDTERILGYRLLTFARGDSAELQRAEENLYVQTGKFSRYKMKELLEEFINVRSSHISMINHLPKEAWDCVGKVSDIPISVRAIGYMMLGHERHHLNLIRQRYLQQES